MKDDRLEKEFDEYFKGVSTTNDITADAKKFVKKRKVMPKFVKFASIAASFVLVFAVALTVILKSDFISSSKKGAFSDSDMSKAPGSSMGDSNDSSKPGSPDYSDGDRDPSSGETEGFKYYTDDDLEKRDASLDDTALPSSLNFIKNFVKSGGTVDNCIASYLDGELTLFTAKLDMQIIDKGVYTHETDIFVEFNKNLIYDELAEYYNGQINYDNGTKYYLTKNGEESKLVILYGGVKYYFNIRSDDENAYAKYLQWIKL